MPKVFNLGAFLTLRMPKIFNLGAFPATFEEFPPSQKVGSS